jgi:preprotein translocase subunit SecE
MAKTNPLEFLQEVRQETRKVTWPSRRETMIMVVLAAGFFLVVDAVLKWGVEKLLFGM